MTVRGGNPRSSARSTFVRRSIMRSRRMRSFLKADSPGPTRPFFWIGVRISLFQKQVCKGMKGSEIQVVAKKVFRTDMLHRTVSAVWKFPFSQIHTPELIEKAYRRRFSYPRTSSATTCSHTSCLQEQVRRSTWRHAFARTEIVGEGIAAKEAHQTVQLTDTILQRRARETPFVFAPAQFKSSIEYTIVTT